MFDETLFGLNMHNMEERINSYFTNSDASNGTELWITRDNGTQLFEGNTVGREQYVTVLEADCLGCLVEGHTERGFLYLYILVAPGEQNHRVDEKCQQEVEQYATHHD